MAGIGNIVNGFDFGALPVTVAYVGETQRDDWNCDQWRITFKHAGGFWSEDYFTGLGHRSKPKPNTFLSPRPVAPAIASVMHSFLTDAEAIDMSFKDWCDTFGYSDDSLKALDVYRQCCDIAVQLRKVFSRDDLHKMREALQDYCPSPTQP